MSKWGFTREENIVGTKGESAIDCETARKKRVRIVALLGPAFVAVVVYVDPRNVAANITAEAHYGYLLVRVLVLANLMTVLVQYESTKLDIVTGRSLPELLGDKLPKPRWIVFWLQTEVVAATTDLAEVIGGAIALYLLFGVPLFWGGVITGVVSLISLLTQNRNGQIVFERLVIGLLLIITLGFVSDLLFSPPDWGGVLGDMVPRFRGSGTIVVAASTLGATVMPHAIHLHPSLIKDRCGVGRSDSKIKVLLQASKSGMVWTLLTVGCMNIALLLLAASALPGKGSTDTTEGAYGAILSTFSTGVATVFTIGLLVPGLVSTSVDTYAGSEIMTDLLHIYVPLWVRRTVALIPALATLTLGSEPTRSLVISQVVLSVGIPLALVPLIMFTRSRKVMGEWRDPWWLFIVTIITVVSIITLDLVLAAMGQF